MRIMVDQAIPTAAGLFARLGEVHSFDGRSLRAADVADADALIVRSVTRVDAALLAGSTVRFVGTATSGTDHVDEAWLAREGIRFAAARGCNARPVAEYVLTAILWLARQRRFDPRSKTLGVVGVGHTGSLVARWAQALGMEVRLCDPPLQNAGSLPLPPLGGGTEGGALRPQHSTPPSPRREPGVPPQSIANAPPPRWCCQSELLAQSDIITLHVPLSLAGPYATREMVNSGWLAAMRPGGMLINTARGEVVAESAVIEARRSGRLSGLVVDVWTGEPAINERLAAACDIATPHIAGYSVEAKRRAVSMIYDALAADPSRAREQAATAPSRDHEQTETPATDERPLSHGRGSDPSRGSQIAAEPPSRGPEQAASPPGRDIPAMLDALQTGCPLPNIDAQLRSAIAEGALVERFDALRAALGQRREFPDHRLNAVQFSPADAEYLTRLGFRWETA